MSSSKEKIERDQRYWEQARRSYIEKNEILFSQGSDTNGGRYYYCDPISFYRGIFPQGFLEPPGVMIDWNEPGGGHPNGIVIEVTHEKRTVTTKSGKQVERPIIHRHTLTDDLDGSSRDDGTCGELEVLIRDALSHNKTMFLAPVSYFGKDRHARNARFLHAFTIDLDGVEASNLRNLLKQIGNGHDQNVSKMAALPQPSAVINSGTGLHLYYVLDQPVPLIPTIVPFLQEVKKLLTDLVWNAWTSSIPISERQYQGIYQAFRMVGTPTKLNGWADGAKRTGQYEVVAFRYERAGRSWLVSLDYLLSYLGLHAEKGVMDELKRLRTTGGRTPIERAKQLWPDWYQRRIVEGAPRGRWYANRALYDWWLRKISDLSQVTYRHRYWCIRELAAYADKCGVPEEELEADAYGLVDLYDTLTEDPTNHFTDDDVAAALEGYGDGMIHLHSAEGIRRRTKIEFSDNKRNGRARDQHLQLARGIKMVKAQMGEDVLGGRPTKCDLIRTYAREHPEQNHSQIAKALGVSRPTVIKWLKPGGEDE